MANQIFSAEDKETILRAMEPDSVEDDLIDLTNIDQLRFSLDNYGEHFFRCLAWLMVNDRIELVIVKPKGRKGIAHYKSGVFSDGDNDVKFKASCNFTAYGLLENLEEVDVDLGWEDQQYKARIEDQKQYFQEIFLGNADYVEYLPAEKIEIAIREQFGDKEIQELLVEETELLRLKSEVTKTQSLRKFVRKLEVELEEITRKPRFPYPDGPREYQKEAYQNWVSNNYKGVFAMATGTGKTITSLNCVLNECQKDDDGVYHAFIIVPTITLVNQWAEEAKSFNFQDIITVSSKSKWESRLATTLSIARRIPTSFIIIGTYASFIRDRFNKYAKQLPSDTLFIADEAHNIGSRSVIERLKTITLTKRIGLSATPKRNI
ncbi:MAG: DEAD/DEAH box helicase family protein [Owenweeksia sp.]|nr:DEAD/DEAH box helicase family protein [Owenweeksia sp.]